MSADVPPAAAWYAAPTHDVFDERHDQVLWGLALTPAGLDALDAAEVDEHGEPGVLVLPCTHPVECRAVVEDLPPGDPDRVEVCGVCGAEHADGTWSA